MVERPRAHGLLSNVLILGSGQLGQWVLSGAYMLLMSRYLGPTKYGELLLAMSVVAMLALITGAGTDAYISRAVARTPGQGDGLVNAGMALRAVLAVPAALVLIAYTTLSGVSQEVRAAAYILGIGMVLGQLDQILIALFRGRDEMRYISLASIVENAATLLLAILVVTLHGSVLAFAITITVAAVVRIAVNVYVARRFVRFTRRISPTILRALVVGSVALWANALFLNFYFYIDSVLLGSIDSVRAVGFYGPPTRLLGTFLVFPILVLTATQPVRSRLGLDASEEFLRFNRRLVALLVAISIPLGIGLATFAGSILGLLFGSSYRASIPVLVVFGISLPLVFMNPVFADILISRDQQTRWSIIMACSAAINPLLNLFLIPLAMRHWHNGALGAALALLATEVLMAVYGAFTLREVTFSSLVGRVLLCSMVAGAGQLLIIWLLSGKQLLVGEIMGGLVYFAIVIALRVVPHEDLALLRHVVLRRNGRQPARTAG